MEIKEFLAEYVDSERMREKGASSVREYIRETIFERIDSKKISDSTIARVLASQGVKPEDLEDYRIGKKNFTKKMLLRIGFYPVPIPIEEMVPVRPLTYEEAQQIRDHFNVHSRPGVHINDLVAPEEVIIRNPRIDTFNDKENREITLCGARIALIFTLLGYLDTYPDEDITLEEIKRQS